MKRDELKVRTIYVEWKGGDICYYDPYEVNEVIAELKARINELENTPHTDNSAVIAKLEAENATLKEMDTAHTVHIAKMNAKISELEEQIENEKASRYTESVDAGMALRKTQRALWLARAAKAKENQLLWSVYCHCDKLYSCIPFCVTTRKNPYRYISRMNVVEWHEFWGKIIKKCLAKAEEYK